MQIDGLVADLKNLFPTARNILIALPVGANIDKLSSGLALYLSLKQAGKEVLIVGEDTIRVSEAHLFGIDQVQKTLPETGNGDLVLTLEGVASADSSSETGWKVPNLTNIDYNTVAGNMELIFRTNGTPLQPTKIVPRYLGSGPELIFVLGAANLNSLGSIYNNHQAVFSRVHLVNIDNEANANFGQTNVVDSLAASISEIVSALLNLLSLNIDQDIATNLLAGIFDGTVNLTSPKVNAETFMTVSQLLQRGGQKPTPVTSPLPAREAPSSGGLDLSSLIPKSAPIESGPALNVNPITNEPFVNPPVVGANPVPTQVQPNNDPSFPIQPGSPEERPSMETVVSESEIEPDWLTPKIFKGNS